MADYTPRIVNVPLTVSTAAYTALDSVGNDATDIALVSAHIEQIIGGGYIAWVRLVDDAVQSEPFTLHCFYTQPSAFADAAKFVPLEADELKRFTVIDIVAADYRTDGTAAYAAFADGKDNLSGEYHTFPNLLNGRMYFYLVCVDTPNYVATDDLTLDICFMVLR